MYRIPEPLFRRSLADLADLLDVGQLLRVQVRKLSLGERMKMELLAALIHRPALLFLDEPTIGLDVVAQQRVRDFLRDLNRAHGTTILLTSHYMDDIEALCPRVLLIDQGRLRFDGPLAALVRQVHPHKLLSVVFADPVAPAVVAAALAPLALQPADDPRQVRLSVPKDHVADVMGRLLRLGRVADVAVSEPPVETIMRTLFDAAGRDRGEP
jgi:ABC-2 type transport system ATP-binding protein